MPVPVIPDKPYPDLYSIWCHQCNVKIGDTVNHLTYVCPQCGTITQLHPYDYSNNGKPQVEVNAGVGKLKEMLDRLV